jgi:hypothetical protein
MALRICSAWRLARMNNTQAAKQGSKLEQRHSLLDDGDGLAEPFSLALGQDDAPVATHKHTGSHTSKHAHQCHSLLDDGDGLAEPFSLALGQDDAPVFGDHRHCSARVGERREEVEGKKRKRR